MSVACPKSNLRARIVDENGEIIWERGQGRGITTDGTLEEIVTLLEDALKQAKGQLISFREVDAIQPGVASPDMVRLNGRVNLLTLGAAQEAVKALFYILTHSKDESLKRECRQMIDSLCEKFGTQR